MVDMLKLVKKYYYHPRMKGSNSIKSVLPAIFYDSEFIKERYSKPVGFGNNLKDEVLWKYDNDNQQPFDPYKILPDTYSKLNNQKHNLYLKMQRSKMAELHWLLLGRCSLQKWLNTKDQL